MPKVVVKEVLTDEKPQPYERRYVVTIDGKAKFKSNRIVGDRVRYIVNDGIDVSRIRVIDTYEDKVYRVDVEVVTEEQPVMGLPKHIEQLKDIFTNDTDNQDA